MENRNALYSTNTPQFDVIHIKLNCLQCTTIMNIRAQENADTAVYSGLKMQGVELIHYLLFSLSVLVVLQLQWIRMIFISLCSE